jgi:hypothetical protein
MIADLQIELVEAEHEGAVRVMGKIRYQFQGKWWLAGISGQGIDRRDAVDAAVKDAEKLSGFRAAVLSVLSEKYPEASEARSPKVESQPGVPAPKAPATFGPAQHPTTREPQPSTGHKGGWPKGKPRKPQANPAAMSPTPTAPLAGAPPAPQTENPSSSKPESSGEPF